MVPEALAGFVVSTLAPVGVTTAMTFGPENDIFVTTLQGSVMHVDLDWTPAGPVFVGVSTFASGFSSPLGLVFGPDGALYVADSVPGAESGRPDGRVTRVLGDERTVVLSGLPNGRHNTNNLRFGPDGMLYVTNGNPNDSGQGTGEPDVLPLSGAILSVDAAQVAASPATLRWRDASGARIPADEVAAHPVNADFRSKVTVFASGFRNIYDVAFSPAGVAYTGTNGADEPASQDLLYRITPGTDYGYPFCYNVGAPGGTGSAVSVSPNPRYGDAARCAGVAPATALLGWHVCATGLDFPTAGPAGFRGAFARSVYVAECGPFFPQSLVPRTLEDPARGTHNTGHKVVRVELDANGEAVLVHDFLTGLALPTDVAFGPDGAMYVADVEAIHRVAQLPLAGTANAAPEPKATPVLAVPGSTFTTYATPVAAYQHGATMTFQNLDIFAHDVVAKSAFRSADKPWCGNFPQGKCPLFWSPLIGLAGETTVQGLEDAAPGTYEFYCTIHASMRGTLVVAPKL